MFKQMFVFEWRYFTRQPSFYITTAIFFALGFLSPSAGMSHWGALLKNGPYLVTFLLLFLGLLSQFLVVNFVSDTAMRDNSSDMAELLYCKPLNPLQYQLGRFFGAFAVVVAVYAVVPLGFLLGSFMPWVDTARFGPVHLSYYVFPFITLSVPTLFVFSCLFYALAIRFKSVMAVYLSVIAVFICYEVSGTLFTGVETRQIGALLDPFALRTFSEVTRYWTVEQRNTQLLDLTGLLLSNRLLWLAIGVVILAVFGRLSGSLVLWRPKSKAVKADKKANPIDLLLQNRTNYNGKTGVWWPQLIQHTKFEVRQVVFHPAFYLLSFFTLISLISVVVEPAGMFGNSYWPTTETMVGYIRSALGILALIVITYYSGEVVWAERSVNFGDVFGSLPVSNVTIWLSKLLALWMALLVLVVVSVLFAMLYQAENGYNNIDVAQYAISLGYFTALPWMMMAVLAFLCQVISPNKYSGMFIFVLFILLDFVMVPLGFEHNLLRFGHSPGLSYSPMNGYGDSLTSHSWYMLYWAALSVILAVIGYGLWQRGPQQGLKTRARLWLVNMGQGTKATLLLCTLVFALTGGNIFYQSTVVNAFYTHKSLTRMHVDYERRYRQFADDPVPAITRLNAKVDIYPYQNKVAIAADIELVNRADKPIKRFLVAIPGYNTIMDNVKGFQPVKFSLEIEGGQLSPLDGELNSHWFEFAQPLKPGERRKGHFASIRQQQGFGERAPSLKVLNNGTFFQNSEVFPRFGYMVSEQLSDPVARKEWGLGEAKGTHALEDKRYHRQSIFGLNSGYLDFETTVSTSIDQLALTSGELQRQWTQDNRNYFHYKMNAPIERYFAYFSGKYDALKTNHNGVDVAVYFDPAHDMNVERIQQAITDSLDYYGENFGPFQHKQAKVVEFAGPANFGQDFPNIIAYSELAGFIHDQRDPNDADQVYWFIGHEMAHQWWGAQLNAANVQGGTMLVETLAQYSAFMLIKKKYGDQRLRQMLKYELDRYLTGRGRDAAIEQVLIKDENKPYLHYNKGALAMMALVDVLGETRLNQSLKAFLSQYKFTQTVYPTTLDLLDFIKQDTTPAERLVIKRLFEEVNHYELSLTEAKWAATDDGQFEVTLLVNAKRLNTDTNGKQTEAPLAAMMDTALFGVVEDGEIAAPIYLQKHLISSGENTIILKVAEQPAVADIDPYLHFIDRDIGDNSVRL